MCIENILSKYENKDIASLILRVSVSALMLFHGISKFHRGIDGIKAMVVSSGLPSLLAYGVYVGEILVPLLLLVGLMTRVSALYLGATMVFAIALAHSNMLFTINPQSGGLMIELPLLYLITSITLFFLGAGKFSIDEKLKQCPCRFKKA
ncbi:MAG TPA: GntR family transcriptional regulator [Sulfurospirillum cavolei]|uniref:GntR family transcriptional regulator n=1 Tax=Sulfurospirillum cavolei TaxID=366522 RepID=A0A2D3WGA4_9BACT|nr:MAG TPA: GntR family transcriptional regulator [Sulfurospirillum cavolei]